jgi:peptide/nickel transport system permease protein
VGAITQFLIEAPTWRGMLSLQRLSYTYQVPWLGIWPGIALSTAVFGFKMFGDALHDLLDSGGH